MEELFEKFDTFDQLKSMVERLKDRDGILHHIPKRLSDIIGDDKFFIYRDKKIKTDYLVDIMHGLMMKYYTTKRIYSNLSSVILKEKYGAIYNYYINWLLDNNFIELVSNYCVGKKAKTYVINMECFDKPLRRRTHDRVLFKRKINDILSDKLDRTNYDRIDRDVRMKIVNDLAHVEINYNKAQEILGTMSGESLHKNSFSVDAIYYGDLYTQFDKYGRVHTNFTTLKSDIRQSCLTIDGYEVEELDIRNSQPLFLTILIDDHNDELNCVDDGEYHFFRDLVINGEFYDYYMENTGFKCKKEAKKSIYRVLFGKNAGDVHSEMFQDLFPTVYDFIVKYKEVFGEDNGNYKIISHELQRSESNFLFNNIIKDIMTHYPEIKLFTVHDSITYPKQYHDEVNDIFNYHLNLLFR